MDLRERLVEAVSGGESRRSAARRFGVSASVAVKWLQRVERTGSVAPDQVGGYRRPALAAELNARGVKAGQYAVWSFFKREGLTFKKNSARGRTGPAGRGQEAQPMEAASRSA
jgi:putative transposase